MKKLFLFTLGIFLMAPRNAEAQTDNYSLQPGKSFIIPEQTSIKSVQVKAYKFTTRGSTSLRYKAAKRLSGIPVYSSGYGFENSGRRIQQDLLPLRTHFIGSYPLGKANIYNASSIYKNQAGNSSLVSTGSLKPKENTPGTEQFGCGLDNNGMNIELTKNACLNLDFGFDDQTGSSDSAIGDSFADKYALHDMDISVSLVFGLR